jgi:hypothetical protein
MRSSSGQYGRVTERTCGATSHASQTCRHPQNWCDVSAANRRRNCEIARNVAPGDHSGSLWPLFRHASDVFRFHVPPFLGPRAGPDASPTVRLWQACQLARQGRAGANHGRALDLAAWPDRKRPPGAGCRLAGAGMRARTLLQTHAIRGVAPAAVEAWLRLSWRRARPAGRPRGNRGLGPHPGWPRAARSASHGDPRPDDRSDHLGHLAPPLLDGLRKAVPDVAALERRVPAGEWFSIADDGRPIAAVEIRTAGSAQTKSGWPLARVAGVADRVFDETRGWLWIGGRVPDGYPRRPVRTAALLDRSPISSGAVEAG